MISCLKESNIHIDNWYVSIPDSEYFNYSDSLQKYSRLKQKHLKNESKYWSYLAELYYLSNDSLQAKTALEKAYDIDFIAFCNNYVAPIYKYLTQRNPHRKTSIPGILQNNPDTFIDLALNCKCHESDRNLESSLQESIVRDYLRIKWVSLYDQWYRIPSREINSSKQLEFDSRNEKFLSYYFLNKNISEIPNARQIVSVVILHSSDCKWVLEWVKKYFDEFKDVRTTEDQLKYFLNHRSACKDIIEVKSEVEKMLEYYL